MEVTLFMYDLSQGMAAVMGPALIGKPVEAIWHTGIVINGTEYYFDGGVGIASGPAGRTRFGNPLRRHRLGTTTRSLSEFQEWNRDMMRGRFSPYGYDLLNNNCNHYSAAAAEFLGVGQLPSTVTAMVGELMASPLGQMFQAQFSPPGGVPPPSAPNTSTINIEAILRSILALPNHVAVFVSLEQVLTFLLSAAPGAAIPADCIPVLSQSSDAKQLLGALGVDPSTWKTVTSVDVGRCSHVLEALRSQIEEAELEAALKLSAADYGEAVTSTQPLTPPAQTPNPQHRWIRCTAQSIPKNAFVGGRESDGVKLFVGRVVVDGVTHVGKLASHLNACNVAHNGGERCAQKEIEALVIENADEYGWEAVDKEGKIPSDGVQASSGVYVARAVHCDGIHCGEYSATTGFVFGYGGKAVKKDEFEVLVPRKVTNQSKSITSSLRNVVQCRALDSVEDLLSWEPGNDHCARSRVLLPSARPSSRQFVPRGTPKILVCHDQQGGYLSTEKYPSGSTEVGYVFRHWHHVDTFVYFSHRRVTIPPAVWVDTAHHHGVRILGTFITEWDLGAKECDFFLGSEDTMTMVATKLVDIALHFNFDGWLINIENPIRANQVESLGLFVSILTALMHSAAPHTEVLWYDSVTKTGELRWQSCLNSNNQMFFNNADGIFTDYHWSRDQPKFSAGLAGERRGDVYTGIDVFGRGTYGGGGYQCNLAMKEIVEARTSAAIFAPAWTYENASGNFKTFLENDDKFWKLLSGFTHGSAMITTLPFLTHFNQGYGEGTYVSGRMVQPGPWQHLSQQQVTPSLETERVSGDHIQTHLDSSKVYHGGHSLRFQNTSTASCGFGALRLLSANVQITNGLLFTFVYAAKGSILWEVTLDTSTGPVKFLLHLNDDWLTHELNGMYLIRGKESKQVDGSAFDSVQFHLPQLMGRGDVFLKGITMVLGDSVKYLLNDTTPLPTQPAPCCEVILGQVMCCSLQDAKTTFTLPSTLGLGVSARIETLSDGLKIIKIQNYPTSVTYFEVYGFNDSDQSVDGLYLGRAYHEVFSIDFGKHHFNRVVLHPVDALNRKAKTIVAKLE